MKLAQDMAPNGSEITILAEQIPDEFEQLRSTPNCKLRVIKGVPSHEHLKSVPVSTQDSVVIMPAKDLGVQGGGGRHRPRHHPADVRQLRAAKVSCARSVGAPVSKPPHRRRAQHRLREDHRRVDGNRGHLARGGDTGRDHVGRPHRRRVVAGVGESEASRPFRRVARDTEGHECYIRDADLYGGADTSDERGVGYVGRGGQYEGSGKVWKAGTPRVRCGGGVVCERARERDELAMGVMRARTGEMVISPAKDATFVFEEGDRIIVLADSL